MKKLTILLLVLCLVLSGIPAAFATETEETTAPTETTVPVREPDQCGEDLRWKYEDGTLTVSGTGAMDDYTETQAPWAEHKEEIEKLVLSGATYIGAEAFRDYDKLTEIDFGYHIKEFGTRAFYGCDGLTMLQLPMSFKIFGEESLRACKNLKDIHCDGGFPSFRLNCLWESYVTIYYPADRPWPVSLVQELEEAFHGRIEFIDSDGNDPYEPTEATEATEAPTENQAPTTEAPTEKPTEAPTTVPLETTQPPVTEATQPEEEEPKQTQPQTEPETTEPAPETDEKQAEGVKILKLAIIGVVSALALSVAAVLLLIFRRSGNRGKYQR
jgi:hypothetical protein